MKRQLYRGAVKAGRLARLGSRSNLDEPGILRVLMYHKIEADEPRLAVSPPAFADQQELLAQYYTVVGLQDVLEHVHGKTILPPRAVLLTFDDGYRNNLENAKPILDEYGHRASIFIPINFMSSSEPLPHDRDSPRPSPTLSWEELRSLTPTFDVGSHGCSHRVLTTLDPEEARREIQTSKIVLEERLGQPVQAFSYPKGSIGDFNADLESMTRQVGYELTFTTLPGINLRGFDRFCIRRHNVEDFGLDYFEALLDGSAQLLALKDTRAGYQVKRTINRLRRAL